MRSLNLAFCTLLLTLPACGDNGGETTTTDPTTGTVSASSSSGSSDTGEPTTSGTSTTGEPQTGSESVGTTTPGEITTTGPTTTSATDSDPTTTDATTTDATTGTTGDTTGDTDGTTGGATSPLKIAIVDSELYADCMPEIDPDPVGGQWYVEFDNTANPDATSATLTKATLSVLADDPPVLEEILATPIESGPLPAGEYISVKLQKLKGAPHSACDHCDEFYLLELEYQEGDVTHHVTEEVTIPCSF